MGFAGIAGFYARSILPFFVGERRMAQFIAVLFPEGLREVRKVLKRVGFIIINHQVTKRCNDSVLA